MSSSQFRRISPAKASPLKSPRREQPVDDQQIQDFCAIIDSTPTDEWLKRTGALQSLVSSIPRIVDGSPQWYNSAKTLRHLAFPISSLLKDARSTVVKRTCESTSLLFVKCGMESRYLLKDLMVTIIGVHAQTVQVIRTYVQAMVMEALTKVPCKAAMPLWLEKLKTDKRKTVREACALYLVTGLAEWRHDPSYLSTDIWMQVGTMLVRTLRDPSPTVRETVKSGLNTIRYSQPEVWEKLVQDPQGPAAEDSKLQRYLLSMGSEGDDDASVVSSRSMASNVSRGSGRGAAPTSASTNNTTHQANPKTKRVGLGPPVRIAPFMAAKESTMVRSPRPRSPKSMTQNGTYTAQTTEVFAFDEVDPFIAGVEELKQKAKRRSRRSSAMQERWRMSNTLLGHRSTSSLLAQATSLLGQAESEVSVPTTYTGAPDVDPTEHLSLAQTLLDAHREHVDKIMETLRLEMDTMKEFELLVMDPDPSRPTEDDVLDYFESVGLCLDQRTASGKELQTAMDRLSQGED